MTTESHVPEDRRYTASHEWVRQEGKVVTVGITDHAQAELTDVVFVDLPAIGKEGKPDQPVMVLESVKTVADVNAPYAGKVVAVNTELKSHPELVNKDPYGAGWLYKLEITGSEGGSSLLDAAGYRAHVEKGGGH